MLGKATDNSAREVWAATDEKRGPEDVIVKFNRPQRKFAKSHWRRKPPKSKLCKAMNLTATSAPTWGSMLAIQGESTLVQAQAQTNALCPDSPIAEHVGAWTRGVGTTAAVLGGCYKTYLLVTKDRLFVAKVKDLDKEIRLLRAQFSDKVSAVKSLSRTVVSPEEGAEYLEKVEALSGEFLRLTSRHNKLKNNIEAKINNLCCNYFKIVIIAFALICATPLALLLGSASGVYEPLVSAFVCSALMFIANKAENYVTNAGRQLVYELLVTCVDLKDLLHEASNLTLDLHHKQRLTELTTGQGLHPDADWISPYKRRHELNKEIDACEKQLDYIESCREAIDPAEYREKVKPLSIRLERLRAELDQVDRQIDIIQGLSSPTKRVRRATLSTLFPSEDDITDSYRQTTVVAAHPKNGRGTSRTPDMHLTHSHHTPALVMAKGSIDDAPQHLLPGSADHIIPDPT